MCLASLNGIVVSLHSLGNCVEPCVMSMKLLFMSAKLKFNIIKLTLRLALYMDEFLNKNRKYIKEAL
jgi:hypothetical protein